MGNLARDTAESTDWDFADAPASTGLHAIHPYPAKFIPQIPRKLIQLLGGDRPGTVLDPFCGSGTTLLEANIAGHHAVGVDANPLACLIAKVKTTPLVDSLGRIAASVAACAEIDVQQNLVELRSIPRVDHWFRRDIQYVLEAIVRRIDDVSDCDVRDALRICLSSIIVRASNQEGDTRYAAVEKRHSPKDVLQWFVRAASAMEQSMQASYGGLLKPQRLSRIQCSSILDVTPDQIGCSVSLVVTSPPYPNAYEYWLYHKYRMYWLGMDPLAVKEQEIGARPHYFKKNHATEHDFEAQMAQCFSLFDKVLTRRGHVCVLVGNSVIHGRHIDNAKIMTRAANLVGFRLVHDFKRTIPKTRKAFNPVNGRINQESVLIFSK